MLFQMFLKNISLVFIYTKKELQHTHFNFLEIFTDHLSFMHYLLKAYTLRLCLLVRVRYYRRFTHKINRPWIECNYILYMQISYIKNKKKSLM